MKLKNAESYLKINNLNGFSKKANIILLLDLKIKRVTFTMIILILFNIGHVKFTKRRNLMNGTNHYKQQDTTRYLSKISLNLWLSTIL